MSTHPVLLQSSSLCSIWIVKLTPCSPPELRDFEPDAHQDIEVDEGNTAVIQCHLPESQPKALVRYSVKQEWLETSKGRTMFTLFIFKNDPKCIHSE